MTSSSTNAFIQYGLGWAYSANAKAYLNPPPNKVRPFFNGGIGVSKVSPGSSNFGGNFGGGVLYELTPRLGLQGSYNFHTVNTPVSPTGLNASGRTPVCVLRTQ